MSVILIASSDPGKREGLAGVSTCDDVNHSSKSICVICKFPDIPNDLCTRPMLSQNLLCVFVTLAKGNCFIAANQLFSSIAKATYARKKV
ncbi:MAG: hypothetical protein Tp136DCM211861_12 [Prokaryotic dsDNA virus sp.]|nr:MAG: hypothetical protein Tp136DCM211861_12 [Prokaryotic dsDNA virus sp.]